MAYSVNVRSVSGQLVRRRPWVVARRGARSPCGFESIAHGGAAGSRSACGKSVGPWGRRGNLAADHGRGGGQRNQRKRQQTGELPHGASASFLSACSGGVTSFFLHRRAEVAHANRVAHAEACALHTAVRDVAHAVARRL